jgi:DNA-binding GntR family transcriptional regulator
MDIPVEYGYIVSMLSKLPGSSSLTQIAYERLRAEVLSGRMLPTQKLKIAELSNRLSVSPNAIREALSRMTSEGLVIAEPQRGFWVAPVSEKDLEDLTSVRVEIEGRCLRRAIAVGGLMWETRLVAAFYRMSRTPEQDPENPEQLNEAWALAHKAFHEALVSACDNSWWIKLRELLYAQSERYRRLSVPLSNEGRDSLSEHRAIMDAAIARDADRTYDLISAHLKLTTRLLLGGQLHFAGNSLTDTSPPKVTRLRDGMNGSLDVEKQPK